jgi:uracil-DNA glycosylase family 4
VFVTNVVLDRPPDKRDPTPEEIAFYAPFLDRMIDVIQPAVIATLGASPWARQAGPAGETRQDQPDSR